MKTSSSFGNFLSKIGLKPDKAKNEKKSQTSTRPSAPPKNPVRLMPIRSGRSIQAVTIDCDHVGVDGCIPGSYVGRHGDVARTSSIGVYFALNHNQCFIAHIECRLSGGGSRIPSAAAYATLKNTVSQRLDAEALAEGWPAKTDAEAMGRMRRSLVMVCEEWDVPRFPVHDVKPGNAVAEAVNEWLQMPPGGNRAPFQGAGLVVKHQEPYRNVQFLMRGSNAGRWQFVEQAEQAEDDQWVIKV